MKALVWIITVVLGVLFLAFQFPIFGGILILILGPVFLLIFLLGGIIEKAGL